jgi:hypothetical protein
LKEAWRNGERGKVFGHARQGSEISLSAEAFTTKLELTPFGHGFFDIDDLPRTRLL